MTALNFDFSQVNPIFEGQSFLPVSPATGWLVVITKDNGFKQVQDKPNNWYLHLEGVGQEGPVTGKEFSLRLNLKNDNPKAVAAAAQELAALSIVCGIQGVLQDAAQLINRPFRVISEQQIDKTTGQPTQYTQLATNGIRDVNGNMAGKAGAGPQTAQPAPQIPPTGQAAPFGQAAPAAAPFGQPQGQTQPFTGQPQGQPQAQPFGQAAPFGAPAGGGGAPAWAAQPGR